MDIFEKTINYVGYKARLFLYTFALNQSNFIILITPLFFIYTFLHFVLFSLFAINVQRPYALIGILGLFHLNNIYYIEVFISIASSDFPNPAIQRA